MLIADVYKEILKCKCGSNLDFANENYVCQSCKIGGKYSDSYICLFSDDADRPFWSMHMQTEFERHGIVLDMKKKYDSFERYYLKRQIALDFFDKISNSGKIIIDLASGPSGYFGILINKLRNDQYFFVTDGSPVILKAHMDANIGKDNIGYIDLDLDQLLPFKDESVDCFMGNYLCNVMEYRQLVSEVHRGLKKGGRFSVIEIFYENNCDTALELIEEGKLHADLDLYIKYFESVGFRLERSGVIEEIVGKLDPSDSLPRNDTDKSEIIAFDFIKL